MASVVYPKAKEAFLSADIDLTTGVIRAVLVDTGVYTYNAAHVDYADLSGVVGTESDALADKTVTNGVFDADDATFTSVTGANAEALILFQDTGDASTSRLIAFIDSATGLPILPNGGDITVAFSSGANRIFSL